MRMLNNPIGIFLYLFLRNDIVWSLLTEKERQIILEANRVHNTTRDDYANPDLYGAERMEGGENWDSTDSCLEKNRGRILDNILSELKPKRILEVGPGAGFYSRLLCKPDFVEEYTALDICQSFLDYLKPRLEELKRSKKLNYELICGDFIQITHKLSIEPKYDLVVLLSTVHHIPNRIELFSLLVNTLRKGGIIFCCDPLHSLLRIYSLLKKCLFSGYLKKRYYIDRRNLSTHHMTTYGEYKKIVKSIRGLGINQAYYFLPRKLNKHSAFLNGWLGRWLSGEMCILIKKK